MAEKKIPSIYEKDWQTKKELGTLEKTFTYMGTDNKPNQVTATATIHPGSVFEKLEEDCKETLKSGLQKMDSLKYARGIMKTVYGIDGTALNNIMDNKGADLFNQMRTFAYSVAGLSLTEDEVEKEKN